jgi:hypothetical protein
LFLNLKEVFVMKQRELERAIARATGESLATIRKFGFLLDDPLGVFAADVEADALGPQVVDWDELEAQRHVAPRDRRPCYEPAAA